MQPFSYDYLMNVPKDGYTLLFLLSYFETPKLQANWQVNLMDFLIPGVHGQTEGYTFFIGCSGRSLLWLTGLLFHYIIYQHVQLPDRTEQPSV